MPFQTPPKFNCTRKPLMHLALSFTSMLYLLILPNMEVKI